LLTHSRTLLEPLLNHFESFMRHTTFTIIHAYELTRTHYYYYDDDDDLQDPASLGGCPHPEACMLP